MYFIFDSFQHWKWSTKNSYFMSCSHACLNIGAGDGHFGLSLDSDLNHVKIRLF